MQFQRLALLPCLKRVIPVLCLLAVCLGTSVGCEPVIRGDSASPTQMVAFTASWCGPCHRQAPLVDMIESTGVQVTRIDIDRQPELARRYGVTSVPTYFLYDGQQPPLRTNQASDILQRIRARR
jgi:thiol-disulfide isomerase/thioredoxin